jgi:hypothetical protein
MVDPIWFLALSKAHSTTILALPSCGLKPDPTRGPWMWSQEAEFQPIWDIVTMLQKPRTPAPLDEDQAVPG